MISTQISIRQATQADLSSISRFIDDHFVKAEPIISSYQLDDFSSANNDDDDDNFIKTCIDNGTTFVAHLSDELVGIFIAGKIAPNEHDDTLELANATNDRKSADIMKFISFIERKADVCNRLGVAESLHIHIISVHGNYNGNGIGGKLFQRCYQVALDNGYSALSVDCTNAYTARMAQKLNMELLSTVDYDEFNEHAGSKLFVARQPHTLIRSFGVKLK